jgi:hypothetical protein
MSIELPFRRRRPAPEGAWVCHPEERPSSALPAILESAAAPASILLGAPERHTRDVPGETGLGGHPRGEAERMQR